MPSSHLILYHSLLLLPSVFPASGSFPTSQLFVAGGQGIGVSASASVLLMNIQDWLPLEWTSLISSQYKGLSRVFSSTTVWKYQFFGAQPSNSHNRTCLLEKPWLWLDGPLSAMWCLCFLMRCLDLESEKALSLWTLWNSYQVYVHLTEKKPL